ncbi:head maturation protease, ClpP-related [Virgibacillus pantothenticus]|uniref:ATP-dependent Clp protease proteolytic subunit n=1 Tax=Virgibacillus pantothenticus TaxID=1473 RepID=A0A0L0QQU4_VIRPA|nr:head maturation protease, ClpP-related [Virgibacillus pantothenticus]KNE20926.1 Clp protease ClpP [Virgibacillus pantothenticus]MED3736630.1 Clp protease ClpP [Virgibacillus pantothenticus]QTY18534.1 Clp protease ClpP [Virgibacillus pantothenticus]
MKVSADGKSGDIFIYGEITKYAWEEYGEKSAQIFKQELDDLGDVEAINLYVNSPGGSVFEGITIHNMLKRHKAKVIAHVDALAASIASVIVMAADEIRMPSNSMLMIHNPWTFAIGNSADLRKEADDLDRIGKSSMQSYLNKAEEKLSEEKLQELLDAETWLSAEEAFEYGLCDVVEEANDMAASISDEYLQRYKNVPKQLKEDTTPTMSADELALRQKIADEAKAESEITKTILGGIYS